MIRFYSSYILVFTTLTHFFCCGVPLLLGISAISTNYLFLGSGFLEFQLFEAIELFMYSFASIILITLVSFEFHNYNKKKFETENCCEENINGLSRKTVKKNIIISGVLYIVNSVFLLSEKIF